MTKASPSFALRFFMSLAAGASLTLLAGCGGGDPASFTPAEDSARQALEMSLKSWQEGKQSADVGALPSGAAVQVVDSDWAAGKKLKSFEIKGETTPAGASSDSVTRQFDVQLEYVGDAAPQQAVYHVVGKDPLLVGRDKDLAQSQGM